MIVMSIWRFTSNGRINHVGDAAYASRSGISHPATLTIQVKLGEHAFPSGETSLAICPRIPNNPPHIQWWDHHSKQRSNDGCTIHGRIRIRGRWILQQRRLLQYLLQGLGTSKYMPRVLFCDNLDDISLAKNSTHAKANHVDGQLHFVRDPPGLE